MFKPLLCFLFVLTISVCALAQNFPYGVYNLQEVDMKRYPNDTSAHAVVLDEYGTSSINVQGDDRIKIVYEYHVKIKILDAKGFNKGTVEIPYYTAGSNDWEDLDDIKGVTTYRDDNGLVQTADLDPSKIVNVRENKYWSNKKFAMPNLRSGAIIEYQYRIATPYWDKFHAWHFQDDIPKVNSEYEVHIPAFWTYNVLLRGNLPLSKNKAVLEPDCFSARGNKCDCSHIIYAMQNIPAFVEEDYMTAPKNFLSAVYFNLSDYTDFSNGRKVPVTKEWKDIDYGLKHAEYFGSQLRRQDLLKPYIAPYIAGKKTDLDKAKAVYAYIQKNIKWNSMNSRGSDDGIRKALDNHTGNTADINLALTTALNAAGIHAEAVLLSTRANGLINKIYPVENEFNYVIARATIGQDTYLLDATDPLLSFGMLPLKCLNDQGRVMSLDKPSYWIDLTTKQKKISTRNLDLTLESNGKLKGTILIYSMGYQAYEKRLAIKKFNTVDEYVENLDERLGKIKILNSEIANVDSLDLPLSEKYEVEIDAFNNLNHNRLAFNPYLFDRIVTNPFKLTDRNYPVDWGMPEDNRFILTVHLPADYTIESSPQNTAIALPNAGGKFITSFEGGGNMFIFSNMLQFNKSIYTVEEYPALKEIYNKIIAAEKSDIVFKKN